MKILFIRKTLVGRPGLAASHYLPIELARLGCEVKMVALAGGDASLLRSNGVEVSEVSRGWFGAIRKCISEFQPDIVHVFIHAGCGLYPLWLSNNLNKPKFVLDIRSPLLRRGVPRLLHRIKNIFEPLFYDAITSHGIESAWTVIGKRYPIYWVPPGVDLAAIPPTGEWKADDGGQVKLVYIGSLNKERNVDLLLEGFRVALAEGVDARLEIFGRGTAERELEKMIGACGMREQVSFLGNVKREELFARLHNYDAGISFVPNGIYETAPPLKAIEYLACGLPVLASNTIGNRLFVKEGENGLLFLNREKSIADVIQTFAGMEDKAGMACRAEVSAREFDWVKIVRNHLIPVYERICHQKGHDG